MPVMWLNWAAAQTIFAFDLTAAHLAGCLDIVSAPSENASWNVHLEFADKFKFSANMIVYNSRERGTLAGGQRI